MKFNPSESWEKKIERLAKHFAARRARLFPSLTVLQAKAEAEARGRTPIALLLDQPLLHDPEETQAARLLARAVSPEWWAGGIRQGQSNVRR